MLNVDYINKNVEMLKNIDMKINFLTQIILFFDKEFKKIRINPFLPNLFSTLVINVHITQVSLILCMFI